MVQWYKIRLAGTQVTRLPKTKDFQKQGKVIMEWHESLCFGVPVGIFAFQNSYTCAV